MSPSNRRTRDYIRKKRRIKIIISVIALIAVLLIGITAIVVVSMPYETVDLTKYVTVTFDGYNTAGTATAVIDEAAINQLMADLKDDYDDALFHTKNPEEGDYFALKQSINCELSNTDGLSNGSKVSLQVSYDKDIAKRLKLDVSSSEEEYTVSDLPTVSMLSKDDLFKDLEVTFTGVSPTITVSMKNNSEHPFIKHVGFEIVDPRQYYAKGDEIVVKANFSDDLTMETNYKVDVSADECTNTYTVEADTQYLSSADDLPSSIVDEAIEAGKSAFKDANDWGVRVYCEANLVPVYINKKATFTYGSPQFVSAYFKTVMPNHAADLGIDFNQLDIIYSVMLTQADGVSCKAYAAVRFTNIVDNGDGTYEYDFSNPEILSESYVAARVKKNVTDAFVNTHEITKIR